MLTVKRSLILIAATLAVSLSASGVAQAAAASAEVEVRDVEFSKVRAPRGGDFWLEAAVELNVAAAPGGGTYGRWADRVGVAISIGVERRDGDYDFYRATAELVAVEAGRATVRFYLPPEIVKREQINSDPYAYAVRLSLAGKDLAKGAVSKVLESPGALKSFEERVLQATSSNDGVLVPQYESPFELEYGADTPSFVRRQG